MRYRLALRLFGEHLACVSQAGAIAACIFFDYRTGSVVSFFACPVSLQLEHNLNPARHLRTVRSHAMQSQFVTGFGESAAGVCHYIALIAGFDRT